MKKTVKSELFERGEYSIEVKEGLLSITSNEIEPIVEIQKVEVKGEIKDQKMAMEIAEKYILNMEQGKGDYSDIEKAFKEVKEYTLDLDSCYGDNNDLLGGLAQRAYNSFGEKVRIKFSTDGSSAYSENISYVVLFEGNVECKYNDELVRINGERFTLESGEYGLHDALSQIGKTTDFLSEESLETYEMLKEKFD